MIVEKFKIHSQEGLHARPAALFVKEAKRFKSTITVKQGEKEANGKSILKVLTLGAKQGSEIEIAANGEDEREALDALHKVIENGIEN